MEDYFYGDDDELTEIKVGTTVVKSFGYDAAGRRTSATYSGVTTNYAYDYESRITSITRTGVTANSFAYNGLDTRVSKTDSTGTTIYKRAGAYVTDSLLKSTVSSTTTDYTPGVSSRVGSDSTFLHSGIKNADTQTDDGGDVSAMRQYDAFGNPVAAWGGWQGPFGYGGPYGYQTDPDHGLMLLGHRYYEADTGRFLTRDPIKDGRNWYGYCGSGPVRSADINGLEQVLIVVGPPGTGPDGQREAGIDRRVAHDRKRKYQDMGYSVRLNFPDTVHELDRELSESDLILIEVIAHGGLPGIPSARIGGPPSARKALVGSDKSVLLTPKRIDERRKGMAKLERISLCVCGQGSSNQLRQWKRLALVLTSYKGKINTTTWNEQHPPKRLRADGTKH